MSIKPECSCNIDILFVSCAFVEQWRNQTVLFLFWQNVARSSLQGTRHAR